VDLQPTATDIVDEAYLPEPVHKKTDPRTGCTNAHACLEGDGQSATHGACHVLPVGAASESRHLAGLRRRLSREARPFPRCCRGFSLFGCSFNPGWQFQLGLFRSPMVATVLRLDARSFFFHPQLSVSISEVTAVIGKFRLCGVVADDVGKLLRGNAIENQSSSISAVDEINALAIRICHRGMIRARSGGDLPEGMIAEREFPKVENVVDLAAYINALTRSGPRGDARGGGQFAHTFKPVSGEVETSERSIAGVADGNNQQSFPVRISHQIDPEQSHGRQSVENLLETRARPIRATPKRVTLC
jgi:hypothetical protein